MGSRRVPRRAWLAFLILALGGIVPACRAPAPSPLQADDLRLDAAWALLQRGEFAAARLQAEEVEDPSLARRVRLDATLVESGRVAALQQARLSGDPLEARYLASPSAARSRLEGAEPAVELERMRRSSDPDRRAGRLESWAGPGGAEALCWLIEGLQARGSWSRAQARLDDPRLPQTRRLRLAAQRQDVAVGRSLRAADSLLADLEAGRLVPESLQLLRALVAARPDRAMERRVSEALSQGPLVGPSLRADELRLRALLSERRGDSAAAAEALSLLGNASAAERRHARRLQLRSEPRLRAPANSEERLDVAQVRRDHPDVIRLQQLAEWDLSARALYASGAVDDWPSFAAALDAAALAIPGATRLAGLPLRDYGVLGVALAHEAASARFEGSFLVGGDALGLPPQLAVYDVVAREEREVEPGGSYAEYLVENLRVPSYLGWRGARFAGAGLERFVFLDLDALHDQPASQGTPMDAPLDAWPAAGRDERRRLDEPLDVGARLVAAARADAEQGLFAGRLDALSEHERRHIVDVREFLDASLFGKLGQLLGAGTWPASVRAELERRAQLESLRRAADPRLPLAEALSVLPVEGARAQSEHAVGYAELVEQLVTSLDRADVLSVEQQAAWGMRRDRVIVQQLHLLPPEAIRELALALR